MPLVPAICTQCGAQIEVDNTHEAGICRHCGTAFITEKAINNYTTHVTNNFVGATVHMQAESELERLITAADTFRRLGDGKAEVNYKEAMNKYPQDPRGWVGYIYTSYVFKDFFQEVPSAWDTQLLEHHIFKTACQLTDPQTRGELELLAENYRKAIDRKLQKKEQKLAEYRANYSLESLIKYIGSDNYFKWPAYAHSYEVLLVRDGILYFHDIVLDEDFRFQYSRIYEALSMDDSGTITLRQIIKAPKEKYMEWHLHEVDYSEEKEICLCKEGSKDIVKFSPQDKPDLINSSWYHMKIEMERLASLERRQGCYIATCVYGSYDCPQVWTLRRFRDDTLKSTWYGRLFIKCYYTMSPTLVKWFGNHNWFRIFWKKNLDNMVTKLNQRGIENTKYSDKF